MIRTLLSILLFSISFATMAQPCATVVPHDQSILFEKWMKAKLSEPRMLSGKEDIIYKVPVVVHVVHQGEMIGEGTNISIEQVQSQIDVLNEDFNRLNADTIYTPDLFKGVAASSQIQFVLAYQDPDGNETNGITRTFSPDSPFDPTDIDDIRSLTSQIMWPPEDYINIYVVDLIGDYIGYSQFPRNDGLSGLPPPYNAETDAVIIDYRSFGSKVKVNGLDLRAGYDQGRSLSHEAGHYFGLLHIWGDGGCGASDYCDDTPDQEHSYSQCNPADTVSCGSRDMYENFMDYTQDKCMNLFTSDQVARMHVVLGNSPRRNSLLTSHALDRITGLAEKGSEPIRIYPNPVKENKLIVRSEAAGQLTVNMFDMNGKILSTNEGQHYIELDLKMASGGVYLIKVSGEKINYISKILVVR
jgi:hypothetical protein